MKLSANPSLGRDLREERAGSSSELREKVQDSLLLALLVVLSLILYVQQLGFYMDDCGFIRLLAASEDGSLLGLTRSLYLQDHLVRERPSQALLLAGLYWLFGLHPFGYHLSNAFFLCLIAILFYWVLREFELPRLPALAIPAVYILLPHYSTDRFWVAAFQATLSIVLYLLSLYSDLHALMSRPSGFWAWKLLGVFCLLGSALAYEVTVPLFLLSLFMIAVRARQLTGTSQADPQVRRNLAPAVGINLLALALVVGYKAFTTTRLNVQTGLINHAASLFAGAFKVNFGTYGLGLPYVIGWIIRNRLDWILFGLGSVLALGIYAYLSYAARKSPDSLPPGSFWLQIIGVGLAAFVLGYAIFLVNEDVWFTSASIGNRLAIAAALGVALSFVGGIGWLTARFSPAAARRNLFCASVSLLCLAGFLINNTLAQFWASAYRQQQAVLADIQAHNPALPSGSTLILDGFCIQQGGAYILNGRRDLAGIFSIAYQDQSLKAAASERSPEIGEDGLTLLVDPLDETEERQ